MTLTKLAYRWSPNRTIRGIPTGVLRLSSQEERGTIFGKVEAALDLISEHAPVRSAQVRRDLDCIFVFGDASTAARYLAPLKMCELYFGYVLSSDTSVAELASTIVHEAQHARLARLGLQREVARIPRIERLCFRAERAFGRRLPDGTAVIEQANRGMEADPSTFSLAAALDRRIRVLREELRSPGWFVALAELWMRRGAARSSAGGVPPNKGMNQSRR